MVLYFYKKSTPQRGTNEIKWKDELDDNFYFSMVNQIHLEY